MESVNRCLIRVTFSKIPWNASSLEYKLQILWCSVTSIAKLVPISFSKESFHDFCTGPFHFIEALFA